MFRAEVIGSMLRPSYLQEGRAAFEQGQLSAADFKRLEDRAVDQVIAMQEGAGVDVVSDGEMRRFLFMGPITETVEGIELVEHDSAMPWSTPEGDIEWTSPAAVTSKLRKRRSLVTEEYSYARARARLPLKVTVPSPLVLYGFWSPKHSTGAYSDAFAMFADAAEIGRSEIQELVSLGCEYIQVDAPELATLVDPRVREWAERMGFGAERMLTEGIDLINAMVEGVSGVRAGDPPVPRQQRRDVDGQRRLRVHRPGALRARDGLRRVLPGVRRRPLGVVRAARRRARRQADRARARVDQDAGAADRPTSCAGASTRRRASSRTTSSASRRSAASPRSPPATRSPRPTRSASCASWPTRRTPSGVRARAPSQVGSGNLR